LHTSIVNCQCEYLVVQNSIKYLGVYLDNDFLWRTQIKHLQNKMRSALKEIKLAKNRLTHEALRTIYHAIVYSHLIYGIVAWGHSSNLKPLQDLQEKILYTMARKSELSKNNNNVYKIWNVLPIYKICEQITIINKYFDQDHGEPRHHEHDTRTNSNAPLVTPVSENKYHERTWSYIMPRLWNKMPRELKNLESKKIVKEKIKEWYLDSISE
jgi:hypothetical protein